MDQLLTRGWRRLAVQRWGAPGGYPVFLLHGTPGSRLGARPSEAQLRRLGVDLITYDRPGYGRSDSQRGRSVADAAEDVRAIADHYRLDEFAVLGRSGGGPHALACAALLPDRVTRVASLVSLAPFDAPGLDWLAGMTEFNRVQYSAASKGSKELARVLYPQVVAMRADPEHLVRRLEAQAPDEHPQLRDPALRDAMVTSIAEAVSRTLEGWAADSLAFTHSWGFDPAWISAPTLLWHVEGDVFSPVAHAHWLAERIRSAVLTLSGRGHLSAGDAQGGAIRWLLHGGPANLASA